MSTRLDVYICRKLGLPLPLSAASACLSEQLTDAVADELQRTALLHAALMRRSFVVSGGEGIRFPFVITEPR